MKPSKNVGKQASKENFAYRRYLRHIQAEKNTRSRTGRVSQENHGPLSLVTWVTDKQEDISFPSVRNLVQQYSEMLCDAGLRLGRLREFKSCDDIFKVSVLDRKKKFDCEHKTRVNNVSDQCNNSCMLSVPRSGLIRRKKNKCNQSGMCRTNSQPNLLTRESLKKFESDFLKQDLEFSDEGFLPDLSNENLRSNYNWILQRDCCDIETISSPSPVYHSPSVSTEELYDNFEVNQWRSTASSDSAVGVEDDSVSCSSVSPIEMSKSPFNIGNSASSPLNNPNVKNMSFHEDGINDIPYAEHSSSLANDANVVFRRQRGRAIIRTPSVIISDHSSAKVSMRIALEQNEVSLEQGSHFSESDEFDVRLRKPSKNIIPIMRYGQYENTCYCDRKNIWDGEVQSEPYSSRKTSECSICFRKFSDCSTCSRKVSDCSTCSSLSTLDMSGPESAGTLSVAYEWSKGYWSDCSSCSYLTASEDETDVIISPPSLPPVQPKKTSNWRKVRNVVQWTPFIQTYKRHKYPWVQLAGHQGNFKAGYRQGTILKKLCPAEEKAFEAVQKDILKNYIPEYLGVVESSDGEKYLQLQDLLSDFSSPCVMDIKMGVRTYLEEELAKARHKPKLRKDMYEKMILIDSNAPTEAENKAKAVTKPRYMVWRETISSTANLGFRIEGVRRGDGSSTKDFKTTRTRDQVTAALTAFVKGYSQAVPKYIQKLKAIRTALESSEFFYSHELIGSSLLFVHNENKADVWLIDFAKTIPLPNSIKISHNSPWVEGTHEDGYLIGLGNLISLLEGLQKSPIEDDLDIRLKESCSVEEEKDTQCTNKVNPKVPSKKELDSDAKVQSETTDSQCNTFKNNFAKNNTNNVADSIETKCVSLQMPKNVE